MPLDKIRSVRVGVAIAVGVAAAAGCASVLDIDSDRHVDNAADGSTPPQDGSMTDSTSPLDAAAEAETSIYPPNWACLGAMVPATPSGNVQLQLHFSDVSGSGGGTPIVGAEVHWCNRLDLGCTTPGPQGSVHTDDAGIALLTVPGGFDGYYEFDASTFTPAVLSRVPQLSDESADEGMANAMTLALSPQLAGVTQQPDRSIAIVTVADCTSTSAAGIVFTVGAPGANEQVVYLQNDLPTTTATETDIVSGSALIFNVPPGTLSVTASFASTQQVIRTVTTIARQGWVTFVEIRPDQATHPPIGGG